MFHKTNMGKYANMFIADMDGYVPEEGDNPHDFNFDHGTNSVYEDGSLTEYGEYFISVCFPQMIEENMSKLDYFPC